MEDTTEAKEQIEGNKSKVETTEVKVDPSLDPSQISEEGNKPPKAPEARAPKEESKVDPEAEGKSTDTIEEGKDKSDPKPLDTSLWGDSGSETGNAVLELLQNSGLKPDEAKAILFDSVAAGKPEEIDRAALEAKVGKATAHLILVGVKDYVATQQSEGLKKVADAQEAVGGAENWKVISDWAKASMPEADRAELSEMLVQGGRQAKLAAKELLTLYNAAEGNTTIGDRETTPANRGGGQAQAIAPLSGAAYAKAYEKLQREHNGAAPEALRKQLLDARNRGKQAGI